MVDWTEKYRPKTLDEIVGNERAINELRKWAYLWKKGTPKEKAIVLSGKPGVGKTSAALALANDFKWTPIELNASDARNAEKIKNVAMYGAMYETFSEHGDFVSSRYGGRKLIILDEADNLYERTEKSTQFGTDFSDKGGKKAIIDTIRVTNQPIVLIVNDYYGLIRGSGEVLKQMCKLIRFYDPHPRAIYSLLKRICLSEGINVDSKVLQSISDRCKGDVRSAVNDLQSICFDRKQVTIETLNAIGYRDREKDIFTALREIFKTRNINVIRETILHLDVDPKLVLLWIDENLPREYIDVNDLLEGYKALSEADVFLGRTYKTQNYDLWSYASDIMNGGVALAKTHSYPNDSYSFPTWLKEKKDIKSSSVTRDLIIKKLSKLCHNSDSKTRDFILSYFINMFRNNTSFAVKMKKKFDLSENEVEYLLGKTHAYKLKEIISASELEDIIKPIKEPVKEKTTMKIEKKDKKEKIQQSLFDF